MSDLSEGLSEAELHTLARLRAVVRARLAAKDDDAEERHE